MKAVGNYIKRLILEGEHQQQDFKFAINDSKKIARSLVAFSNTDGGRLLIGVKDNGSVAGVHTDEEYYMIDAAAKMYCKPEIHFTHKQHIVDGKMVLEIIVEKSDTIPHFAPDPDEKWKAYVRVKDQNLLANKVLLEVWKRKKDTKAICLTYTDIEKKLFEYLHKNERITISKFARISHAPVHKARQIMVNLILLNLIEMDLHEHVTYYSIKDDAMDYSLYMNHEI